MPKEVILIAAVTVDGFIARHSLEVTSWSKDLRIFKKQTMGFPVIMGSNTDKTLSSNLRGRKKIVVGRKDNPKSVLTKIKEKRCFVIGGGKTFYRFSCFFKFRNVFWFLVNVLIWLNHSNIFSFL